MSNSKPVCSSWCLWHQLRLSLCVDWWWHVADSQEDILERERDALHISVRKGRSSGTNCLRTDVGIGSREQDLAGAFIITDLTSSMEKTRSSMNELVASGSDDNTGEPPVDLRIPSIFPSKNSKSCCAVGQFLLTPDNDFFPRICCMERHSFLDSPALARSWTDQYDLSFCLYTWWRNRSCSTQARQFSSVLFWRYRRSSIRERRRCVRHSSSIHAANLCRLTVTFLAGAYLSANLWSSLW